eukprot:TRINITY_DN15634_c0_g1_i1.p1 TRINITY_DN15634_c0_g1~~TRINITY_DN15634_c0_g1_i1.p1  ORF type:complete len:551 (-),score=157.21 TRINITY_DN15634_c0_g1_i1:60-1571(-)
MLVDSVGDVTVTNDGATILSKLQVEHPAAKVLVDLAQHQDKEVGDGTTTVVILAAEFLKRGNGLVKKIHPTNVISGFRIAMRQATNYIRQNLSIPLASLPHDALLNCAKTAISSKIIGANSDHFANIIVNSLKRVGHTDASGRTKYPVGHVNILKAPGKSALESVLIEGYALNCTVSSQAMLKSITKAKIAFLDFGLEKPQLPHGISWQITDPSQAAAIYRREEAIIQERIKLIIDAGANVILTTRGLDDLAAKYLIDAGAIGVRRVEMSDMKHIAEATGGQIILTLADLEGIESFDVNLLGEAESVAQEKVASKELIIIRGPKSAKSSSIILRGANPVMLDEMERSVHDSLMAVKRVLESKEVVPGGGAVETAVAMHLETFAESLGTREQLAIAEFASAMLVIPKILSVNAAKDATDLVAKLCTLHTAAQKNPEKKQYSRYGLELFEGTVQDNVSAGVLEPTLSKLKSIKFATEAAISILRIDDLFRLNAEQEPDQHQGHGH